MRSLLGTSGLAANKKLKGSLPPAAEGTRAFRSAGAPSPSEAPLRRGEPPAASVTPSGSRAGPGTGNCPEVMRAAQGGRGPAAEASSPRAPAPQDALWLQEVSNLAEWLRPGP